MNKHPSSIRDTHPPKVKRLTDLKKLQDVGDHDGDPGEGRPDDPGNRLTRLIPRKAVAAPVKAVLLDLVPFPVFLFLLTSKGK